MDKATAWVMVGVGVLFFISGIAAVETTIIDKMQAEQPMKLVFYSTKVIIKEK